MALSGSKVYLTLTYVPRRTSTLMYAILLPSLRTPCGELMVTFIDLLEIPKVSSVRLNLVEAVKVKATSLDIEELSGEHVGFLWG